MVFRFLLIACFAATTFGGSLTITPVENKIVLHGVTPGGRAVLYGVNRQPQGFESRVLRYAIVLEDVDRDGIVSRDVDALIDLRSVWFGADLDTGEFVLAAPGKVKVRPLPLRPLLKSHLAAGRSLINPEIEFYDFVLVRPGVGAWRQTIGDGGRHDADTRHNGAALGALQSLQPFTSLAQAPSMFTTRDVILIIDPHTLEALIAEIR